MSMKFDSMTPAAPEVGLGAFVGAAMAGGSSQRRVASAASLAEKLQRSGVALVTAELGRTPAGPAWVLTVEAPNQRVVTVNAQLLSEQDPYSVETSDELAERVMRYIQRTG